MSESVSQAMSESESPFPEYMDAQRGQKRRTHRGRRSRGKGPRSTPGSDHHAQAKAHIQAAIDAPTPKASTAHLFKALSSLKKC